MIPAMRLRGKICTAVLAIAALVSGAATIAACTSFSAVDPQPAGADASDATDGALDASGTDAGATEAAATGFCGMHADATLCSDFDGTKVTEGWVADMIGGTLVTDETLFHSPLRSLRAMLPGTQPLTTARLLHDIPLSAKRARLSLAFFRGKGVLAQSKQISIAEIYCGSPGVNDGVFLFLENPSFDLKVHDSVDNVEAIDMLPPLVATAWTVIVLDARLDTVQPTVDVTIGGAAAKRYPLAPGCLKAPTFQVRAGLATYTGASVEGFFDDLLYEIDPP